MESILGYSVFSNNAAACVEEIFNQLVRRDSKTWFACLNPHSYAVACDDHEFSEALKAANWLVPDGVGLVIASKLLGGGISERITGSDIFFGLHARLNEVGRGRVFFLGASDETLKLIKLRMLKDYPCIEVAGVYSPPFKPSYTSDEIEDMVRLINSARPDVLWVGMTAPKQEKWIYENLHRLDVHFCGAIGAVFDFYVGNVKRSHPLFQRLGLEWLPRLIQQPRRLWRRMFISAPIFLFHVFRRKLIGR